MAVQDEIGIHESSINQNPNGTILVIFCPGPTFVKEICRSASTFRILKPYPSKYIALDLSQLISH